MNEASAGPESIEVSGAVVSTVKVREAGVGSVLVAMSVARTAKLWGPSARVPVVSGEEQELKPPPSIEHSKVLPGSFELKVKAGVAVVMVEPSAGPESIVVSGAAVSMTKVLPAGWASGRFVGSTARTTTVCSPSASVSVVKGDVQAENAAPSTEHSKVESFSEELNVKVGVASFVRDPDAGPLLIVVRGGASTVKLRLSGVGSGFPA